MSTLNSRQQFIKNCFGEIKEQIAFGVQKGTRGYQLFNRVIKELNNNRYKAPYWELNNVEDKNVYDAIVTFFLICEKYGNDKDSIKKAVDYFTSIAAFRTFPPSLENEGAQANTHQFLKFILSTFVNINEDKKKDEDNKIKSLIENYSKLFGDNTIHSYKLLDFNRLIRNSVSHSNVEFEPRLRQEVAVQFLYNFIIMVYLLKYHLRKDLNKDFAVYYNENKKNYYIPVYIDAKEETFLKGGETDIEISKGKKVYNLCPFTNYHFEGYHKEFNLNEYCYNATITPPTDTEYDTIIDLPQKESNEELKNTLAELQDTISRNLNDDNKNIDGVRELVRQNFEKTKTLLEIIQSTNTEIENLKNSISEQKEDWNDLKQNQEEIKNNVNEILKNAKTLDDINKLCNELCENSIYQKYERGIDSISSNVNEVKANVNEVKAILIEDRKQKEKLHKIIIAPLVIFVCSALSCYLFRVNIAHFFYDKYQWEWCCNLIYKSGDSNIAYEYAQFQERNKNFPQAAEWYRRAIKRYEEIVTQSSDTLPTEAYFRLAWMYFQAKGGTWDLERAARYASKIKHTKRGVGIYALLCSVFDNEEAENQIVYIQTKYANHKDDFMLLAETLWQLNSSNMPKEYYMQAENTLKRLALKKGSPLRGEVLNQIALSQLSGDLKHGKLQSGLFEGLSHLQAAAVNENHIPSQMEVADWSWRIGQLRNAKKFYELAVSNGVFAAMQLLIDVSRLTKAPQKYIDSLLTLQESCPKDSFLTFAEEMELLRAAKHPSQSIKKGSAALHKALEQPYKYCIEIGFLEDLLRDMLCSNEDLFKTLKDTADVYYLSSIKFAKGYGVEKNQEKADSFLQLAISKGNEDAIYTYGNLLYFQGKASEAIMHLKIIENTHTATQELLSFIYKGINNNLSKDYLKKITDDTRLYKPLREFDEWYESHNLLASKSYTMQDFDNINNWIHILEGYLCRNRFFNRSLSSEIAGRLAVLYYCSNAPYEMVDFYTVLSANIDSKGCGYYELVTLSTIALVQGNRQIAEKYYESFCETYFNRHGIDHESDEEKRVREGIIGFMDWYFKGMKERVSKKIGKDISKGLEGHYFIETDNKGNKWVNPPIFNNTMGEYFPAYPF